MNSAPWAPEKWAEVLWEYFLPQVQSGKAVYFSIDKALLHNLVLKREPPNSDDPIEHLSLSCETLCNIYGQRVQLKEEAFAKNNIGLSKVICIIALQVVAVELMTTDAEFSEKAYFPRLRKLIGVSDVANPNSNPFHKNQFEKIWKIFKLEIISQVGGTINSITFRKGTGQNLHRELPFTQAMLTGGELYRLHHKYKDELYREFNL